MYQLWTVNIFMDFEHLGGFQELHMFSYNYMEILQKHVGHHISKICTSWPMLKTNTIRLSGDITLWMSLTRYHAITFIMIETD
jgi:hypothetical protein